MPYVYAIVINGTCRYIGKGTGDRLRAHMKIVRSVSRRRAFGETVETTKFYNRLIKAWRSGAEIQFQIIADNLSDRQAFDLEVIEISARRGLWNESPGGTGFSVTQWGDPKFRAKMAMRKPSPMRSIIAKAIWSDPDSRAAITKKRWPNGAQGSMREKEREARRQEKAKKLPWRKPRIKQIKRLRPPGSFTKETATIVSLNAWKDRQRKEMRLKELGRKADGTWKGQK